MSHVWIDFKLIQKLLRDSLSKISLYAHKPSKEKIEAEYFAKEEAKSNYQ